MPVWGYLDKVTEVGGPGHGGWHHFLGWYPSWAPPCVSLFFLGVDVMWPAGPSSFRLSTPWWTVPLNYDPQQALPLLIAFVSIFYHSNRNDVSRHPEGCRNSPPGATEQKNCCGCTLAVGGCSVEAMPGQAGKPCQVTSCCYWAEGEPHKWVVWGLFPKQPVAPAGLQWG